MGGRRHPEVRIGCSGWIYPHWRGRFYPEDLPEKDWFAYYARTFDTVEINNSFYHLPSAQAVAHWAAQAPPGFVYAVKANRFITHMKKLKNAEAPLGTFLERMAPLGPHLGPILYQLPPHWKRDLGRLRAFLALLPKDRIHVFEFRDQSWMDEETLGLLEKAGASFCTHDMTGLVVPRVAVGPIAYVRFHGTLPGYAGGYPDAVLADWGRWVRSELRRGRSVYAYFNNDVAAHAVFDAERLRRLVGRGRPRR